MPTSSAAEATGRCIRPRSAADGTLAAVKILRPKAAKQADRAERFDTEIRALID